MITLKEKEILYLRVVGGEIDFWELYTKKDREDIFKAKYYSWVLKVSENLQKFKYVKVEKQCLVLTSKGREYLETNKSEEP